MNTMSEQSEKSCADCRIIGSSRCYLVCDNLSLYEPTEKPNTETNDLNSENGTNDLRRIDYEDTNNGHS